MKKIQRIIISLTGIVLLCLGIVFMAQASFGQDSLTLLIVALQKNFGLSLGLWNSIVGVLFLIVAFFSDKKKIGFTTIFYVSLGEFIIDFFTTFIPQTNNIYECLMYAVFSTFFISLGSCLAVCSRLGLTYYDAFLYGVTDRFNIKYLPFRYSIEGSLIIASLFLKTYPGLGTIIYFIVMGPTVSFMLKKLKAPIRKYLGLKEEY